MHGLASYGNVLFSARATEVAVRTTLLPPTCRCELAASFRRHTVVENGKISMDDMGTRPLSRAYSSRGISRGCLVPEPWS